MLGAVVANDDYDASLKIIGSVFDTLSSSDYWLGIFTSFFIVFIRHRIKLPYVRVVGGSGGTSSLENGDNLRYESLSIMNTPSFLGYPVRRDTLSVKSSRIFDPATRNFVGPLMIWEDGDRQQSHKVEIEAGDSADLYIYGVLNGRTHYYCGRDSEHIKRSHTLVEVNEEKKLEIHIEDKLQRTYKIPFKIKSVEERSSVDGVRIRLRVKTTLNDRMQRFKNGFIDMVQAFTKPGY
jgi:hypothetical protein